MLQILPVPSAKGRGFLKARIYPSCDFTIGVNHPPKRDGQKSSATDIETVSYWNGYKYVTYNELTTNQRAISAYIQERHPGALDDDTRAALFAAYESSGDYEKGLSLIRGIASSTDRPMGLSATSNSHKLRSRRGLKGVTSYGKRMIRSAAAVLEEKHGRRCLTLGTNTLPTMEPHEFDLVCINWADLTRKFFQELQRLLFRKGLDTDYVQVTEIQEKRFKRWGQIAPHLHWVIQGRKSSRSQWAIAPHDIRSLWERLLSNLLGREVDGSAATRIEAPRKSLLAELGKYISKGSKAISSIVAAGHGDKLPSAWWGCSKPLKAEVKRRIVEDSGELTVWLCRNLERLRAEGKVWYTHIYQDWTDPQTGITREIHVGTVGRFNSRAFMHWILGNSSAIADSPALHKTVA